MNVLLGNGMGLLEDRKPLPLEALRLSFEKDGVLTLINASGIFRISTKKGTAEIPKGLFAEGENRLIFRQNNELYHLESLLRSKNQLTPMGADPLPLLCALSRKNAELSRSVTELRCALEETEKRLCGYRLF